MSNPRKRGRGNTSPPRNESIRPARTQPPRLITSALSSTDRFTSLPQPIPTPESQNAYNAMRDAAAADLLTAPSVRSATMSRSPSATSSSCSLTHGFEDMGMNDSPSPNANRQRKKPKRNGPLPEMAKTKAAFFRKIGVCDECHNRKVKCELFHHDLRLFEQGYKERGHLPQSDQVFYNPLSLPRPPLSDFRSLLPINVRQPASSVPLSNDVPEILLGVGGAQEVNQPSAPPHQISDDLNSILQYASAVSPMTSISPASPVLQEMPVSPITPGSLGGRQSFNPLSHLSSPTVSIPAVQSPSLRIGLGDDTQQPACTPIGRLIDSTGMWECQGGGRCGSSPPSVSSFSNASTAADTSLRQIASLQGFLSHYQLEHNRYQDLEDPYLFKCSGCGYLSNRDRLQQCLNCEQTLSSGRISWEMWYYVSLLRSTSLAAERVTSVPVGTGSFSFQFYGNSTSGSSHSTQWPSGTGGHSNLLHPSQQYCFGADGRGRHRSNKDANGPVSETDEGDADIAKPVCPLRQLVPATLDPMCSPMDKACGWRQPCRSRSRARSRSRSCVPRPGSSCPLSTAGRPIATLLLTVGRWLLPLLLVLFLTCVFALSSSPASATDHRTSPAPGDADPARARVPDRLGPLPRNVVHTWVFLVTGGLLGTWLLSTVGAGMSRLGRLRTNGNVGRTGPSPVAGAV